MKFNFDNAQFDYKPYPICYIPKFINENNYNQLANSYPDISKFANMGKYGHVKYSLAEHYNPEFYQEFLKNNPTWNEFYNYVKSKQFVLDVLDFLKAHNIDLGIKKKIWFMKDGKIASSKWMKALACLFNRRVMSSKFEFSMLPANGGQVTPHTDSVNKTITLVVSFIKDGEWKKEWGGGTSVNDTKDDKQYYNQVNNVIPFEQVKEIKTFPFDPNQCVLFIKTYNSLHSVYPMNGPEGAMRKTATVCIKSFA